MCISSCVSMSIACYRQSGPDTLYQLYLIHSKFSILLCRLFVLQGTPNHETWKTDCTVSHSQSLKKIIWDSGLWVRPFNQTLPINCPEQKQFAVHPVASSHIVSHMSPVCCNSIGSSFQLPIPPYKQHTTTNTIISYVVDICEKSVEFK